MLSAHDDPLRLDVLYRYGLNGRAMVAARAPFAMLDNARELVGRTADVEGERVRIVSIARQISGPVAKGEPIGIEIADGTGDDP